MKAKKVFINENELVLNEKLYKLLEYLVLNKGVLLFKENGIILTFNNYRGTSIVAFICQRYMHIYNAELFRQF